MKRLVSVLLTITLVLSCMFTLSGCSGQKYDLPEAPAGYRYFEGLDLAFAYPEDWVKSSLVISTSMVSPDGKGNILVILSQRMELENLDLEKLKEGIIVEMEEQDNMEVSNTFVRDGVSNNGLYYILVGFDSVMSGTDMEQHLIYVSTDSYTYVITVTELAEGAESIDTEVERNLVSTIIHSLYDKPTDVFSSFK